MNLSLEGKSAVVTGAGRGIGRAIASKLAEAGAAVLLVDIDAGALEQTESDLRQAGHQVEAAVGNLTHPDCPQEIIDKVIATFGGVDIVVNNAGYTWDNVIQKTTDEQFQAMLDIHVVTPFRLLRAASAFIRERAKEEASRGIRTMRKAVNVTSISGIDGNPGQVAYGSGKAAVVGLTKSLAKEWGRYNVTVNAVGFGLIDTRLIKPMEDEETHIHVGDRDVQVGMQSALRDQITEQIPLRRLGTPEDAANAAFFFCSPLSDYVTGEVLVCSGGMHF